MPSLLVVLCNCVLIFLAAVTTTVEASRQFQVGDHLGWRVPDQNNTAFYTQWAQTNRFQIGDSLVFVYQNDSLLTVEKYDYFNCDTTEPITTFTNGKSTLNLDRSGAFYFISGTLDHCNHGQKLLVEVMAPHPIPALSPPPTISIPPQVSISPAMAPSPYSSESDTIQTASSSAIVFTSSFVSTFVTVVVMMMFAL
ncbi:early nodulin-like protein 7 [Cicer arietinum]|uniref:Early nodulin-like protein 1 n=1 Tax=Cicer arietinum TaxID=3827 RepID=A0A1S2XBG1_CICAR|nr:early nodulin-like protein 1 [Cicer arietinum]